MSATRLSRVNKNVEELLKTESDTRNDDLQLVLRYLDKFHGVKTIEAMKYQKIPSFESITRARRAIQAGGKYKAEEVVADARYEEEAVYVNYYGIS